MRSILKMYSRLVRKVIDKIDDTNISVIILVMLFYFSVLLQFTNTMKERAIVVIVLILVLPVIYGIILKMPKVITNLMCITWNKQ